MFISWIHIWTIIFVLTLCFAWSEPGTTLCNSTVWHCYETNERFVSSVSKPLYTIKLVLLRTISKRNLKAKSKHFYYWTSKILLFISNNTMMQSFIHIFFEVVLGMFSEWISPYYWVLNSQFPISHPTKCTFILTAAWQMTSKCVWPWTAECYRSIGLP